MTVKLPEKAGFMPTPDEWDALVRIAENLGAQVVQRDAALARVERERAELIETVARLRAALAEYENGRWHSFETVQAIVKERDAARGELRVLRGIAEDTEGWAALFGTASQDALFVEATIKGQRAVHVGTVEALDAARAEVARLRLALEDAYTVGDVVQMRLYIAAALRGQPAQEQNA